MDNSLKAILINVLYQIWEADSVTCEKAIRNLFNRFNQSRNLEFYWKLFNDVRRTVTRDLYCIIDGLDECIKEFKFPRKSTADERLEGFLKRLCSIAKDPNTLKKTPCTKILITTRPILEVQNAKMGAVVLEIQESDTKSAVGKFVEDGVRLLAQMKHLSLPAQGFIGEKICQKSGHVFLTAQTALRRLRTERYDLENREVVSRAMIRISSQRSDDAYEETLEILESAPQQDQVKAARILRILFFLQRKLSLLELEHALLTEQGSEAIPKAEPIQSTLNLFIRANLALLVKIDDENMISLQHQTVREYLQSLSGDRREIYSCAERKGGHLQLALKCICYLMRWRHHAEMREALDTDSGSELVIKLNKAPFTMYASRYWDLHTREAGELIIPYMPLVDELLGFNNTEECNDNYMLMLSLRWSQGLDQDHLGKNQAFLRPSPGSFLASRNLIEVLRRHTRRRKKKNSNWTKRIAFGRSQTVSSDAFEADFDLNMQDKSGFGLTPLHHACLNGHLEVARLLLDCGASSKVYDASGITPFSRAVRNGWDEVAELLIERNQSWDDPLCDHEIPTLHLACRYGMAEVVQYLLGMQCDPNARIYDSITPVHAAVEFGQTNILEILLRAGGSADSKTKDGSTPLHLAAAGGHLTAVNLLADKSTILVTDKDKRLPIHVAAENGHLETVRRLLQLGQEVGMSVDVKCRDLYATVEESPDDLLTPLLIAVKEGHPNTSAYLIDEGADLNVRSFRKHTLLHGAACANLPETFEFLLKRNLDPFEVNENEMTPLHVAAHQGSSDIITIYLGMQNVDAGLNMVDAESDSALSMAIGKGHPQIAEKLVSRGANIHHLDGMRYSSLALSVDLEDMTLFQRLLEKGADVNIPNVFGRTALHRAAEHGKLDACEMLIDRGADIHAETYSTKMTPLHFAAQRHNEDIVLRLLNSGADPFQKDLSGNSILDYVTTHQPMIDLLRKYRKEDQPRSGKEQIDALEQVFCTKLREFPTSVPTDYASNVGLSVLVHHFSYASWHLKTFDIFRICLEYQIAEDFDLTECDVCRKTDVEGPWWRCKLCPSTTICSDCYRNRSKGICARGCGVDHEHLEIAGEEWRKLEKGKVNAQGQTFWEWIAELKEIYLTGDDVKVRTPGAQPEEMLMG